MDRIVGVFPVSLAAMLLGSVEFYIFRSVYLFTAGFITAVLLAVWLLIFVGFQIFRGEL